MWIPVKTTSAVCERFGVPPRANFMKLKPVAAAELFVFAYQHALNKHEAERGNHAIHARDARERAVIVLRLLAGEDEWGDGYERKLDDCFEMNDGDAVCGWLIEFAEADPRIHRLLFNHYNCGQSFQKHWAKYRNAHRAGELALA